MNKTRVTDSLAVVIGPESIEVLITEGFLFDVAIRFVKVDETNLDQGNEKASIYSGIQAGHSC